MSLPSRKQQIDAVARFLDSERNEGRSLEEIAAEIVDGYHEALLEGIKKPATPLRRGMLFKLPIDGKVRRVSWLDDRRGKVWIVGETSQYGWLGPIDSPTWDYGEEYIPKRRIEVDGKGKMVEMTPEEIEEAWSNPDWNVGDQVSQHQREFIFEVVATGPACVLLENVKTGVLNVDSNRNLSLYYKREVKGLSGW